MKPLTTIILLCMFLMTPLKAAFASNHDFENLFYYFPGTSAYQSVSDNYRDIDILAPQIYSLGYDKKLSYVHDTDILDLAADKDIEVMPLVTNVNSDKKLVSDFLDDTKAQEAFIKDLIDEADERDFIGWQLDFENIDHTDRVSYVDFVEKTYDEFQDEDLILSVAIIPSTEPYDSDASNHDWSSGYDVAALANHSDFISLMTYDDPHSTGPVASMTYVTSVLDYNLEKIAPEKISLGIPFYCWQYEYPNPKKIAAIPYPLAKNTQEKYKRNGVASLYLDDIAAEVFLFIKNNKINIAWCDNVQSFETKRSLAKDLGLRGISGWALGQEDERIWKTL